jgi:hypothetical protein
MNDTDPTRPSLGRASDLPDSGPDRRPPARSRGSRAFLIAAVVVTALFLAIGAFVGYSGAIVQTRGGFEGTFGIFGVVVVVGGMALVLAIVGGIAHAFEATRSGGRIARWSAGAVIAGAVVGAAAVPVLGLRYHEPIVTLTQGSATLALPGTAEFVGLDPGSAECNSVPDGTTIEGVSALDLGTLRGSTMHAQVQPPLGSAGGSVSLSVDPNDGDPLNQPTWGGQATFSATDDGRSGTVTFEVLALELDPKMTTPDAAWPRSLTGTLTWTCG